MWPRHGGLGSDGGAAAAARYVFLEPDNIEAEEYAPRGVRVYSSSMYPRGLVATVSVRIDVR